MRGRMVWVCIGVMAFGGMGGALWGLRDYVGSFARVTTAAPSYGRLSLGTQTQITSIVFVASDCAATSTPGFAEAVAEVNRILGTAVAREAEQLNIDFQSLGVANDYRVADGLDVLSALGPFHQIAVGSGWSNWAISHFLWRDGLSIALVPQMLVLRTDVEILDHTRFSKPSQVLAVKRDAPEIIAWAAKGEGILDELGWGRILETTEARPTRD